MILSLTCRNKSDISSTNDEPLIIGIFYNTLFIYSLKENMKAVSIIARIKCALVLLVFMSIPMLPITSTIGLFIVIFRPLWFKKLVDKVYADKN